MSTSEKLNISGCPSKFELMAAYYMPATSTGQTISLSTDDGKGGGKSFWTADVHSCTPVDGSRDSWMVTGYITRGTGAMRAGPPYEALLHTGKNKGWLRVLEGEIFDHKVQYILFKELRLRDTFVFVGPTPTLGQGSPFVMRKEGPEKAITFGSHEWLSDIGPDTKVVRVRI